MVSFEFEFLDLDVSLKDVGNFGIEEYPDVVLLEGEFDVVVVGSVDDEGEIDFGDFDAFRFIGDGN